MLERSEIKKRVCYSLGIVGLILASCQNPTRKSDTVVNVDQDPSANNTVLLGPEKWVIRKMGRNIFQLQGRYQEKAVEYISSRCEVLSIGVWDVDGGQQNTVNDRVVIVRDGACLSEFTK